MSTTTVEAEFKVRLSCHHVVIMGGPVEPGDLVTCMKCKSAKDDPRTIGRARRAKQVLANVTTQRENIAALVEPEPECELHDVADHPNGEPLAERVEIVGAINGDTGEVAIYDVQAANDEWKAAKAWRDGGRKGDAPATTNLDAMNATHAAGGAARAKRARKSKAANPRRAKLAGLRFYVGDRRMPDSQNKLSSVAWQATKSMPAGRMSTVALTELLATAGIADPEGGAWSHELVNGTVISAQVEPV